MANMGLDRLALIGPACDHLSEEGKQGAVHAQAILQNAVLYPSQSEFLKAEGAGLRIALSGRDGNLHNPENLDTVLVRIAHDQDHIAHDASLPIHLIFGPEDDGLSNEDMALAHHVCRLPTFGEITSLNLSHAVLLAAYIARTAFTSTTLESEPNRSAAYYPEESIKRWLEALGFDLSAPRVSIEKTLNRIFLSRAASESELRILDSVLHQTIRKLKKTRE